MDVSTCKVGSARDVEAYLQWQLFMINNVRQNLICQLDTTVHVEIQTLRQDDIRQMSHPVFHLFGRGKLAVSYRIVSYRAHIRTIDSLV